MPAFEHIRVYGWSGGRVNHEPREQSLSDWSAIAFCRVMPVVWPPEVVREVLLVIWMELAIGMVW